jgi:hypothetical protein
MKPSQIIAQARNMMDDEVVPYKWTTEELVLYLNDCIYQECRELQIINDNLTAAICTIAMTSAAQDYAVSPRIIRIKQVLLAGITRPLDKATQEEIEYFYPSWRTETGQPTKYCLDYQDGFISFDRKPATAVTYTCSLSVVRLPLLDVVSTMLDEDLELPEKYHFGLPDGIVGRGYLKQDAECLDKEKAEKHTALFNMFIEKKKREKISFQTVNRSVTTHYGAI